MSKNEIISKALSDADILHALDNDVNIVKYSELRNMKNIDDLLKYDRAVILFELKKNNGHWCSVIRNKNSIIFTDSYGMFPENELNYVPVSFKFISKQDRGYLLKLLYIFLNILLCCSIFNSNFIFSFTCYFTFYYTVLNIIISYYNMKHICS